MWEFGLILMMPATAGMETGAVQSSRLCILYAARRNRLRRRARDLLFGNQRIPGVFIWAAPRDCVGAHWRIFSANAAV